MTFEARNLSITVCRPLAVVCDFLAHPMNFPQWASGLASGLAPLDALAEGAEADSGVWTAQAAQGDVTLRFSPPNDLGVADHWVLLPDGTSVYVPLRAVANSEGAEVILTLFRQPSMDARQFEDDAQWVMRDLQQLKAVLEGTP